MCFGPEATPPPAPRTGRLLERDDEVLTAADGNRLAVHVAVAEGATAGIVIVPDVRGLHPYYAALADTFADAGVHAVALDLYGRTAGPGPRGPDFDHPPHRAAVRDETIALDVDAALQRLTATGATTRSVIGFCFGGRVAFMQGVRDDLTAVVGLYGWPTREEDGGSSPVREAREGRLRTPVLAIYGGADAKITADDREAFDRALAEAEVPHDTVVYDGAPHSFFDRRMPEHEAACQDVWRRVLDRVAPATPGS